MHHQLHTASAIMTVYSLVSSFFFFFSYISALKATELLNFDLETVKTRALRITDVRSLNSDGIAFPSLRLFPNLTFTHATSGRLFYIRSGEADRECKDEFLLQVWRLNDASSIYKTVSNFTLEQCDSGGPSKIACCSFNAANTDIRTGDVFGIHHRNSTSLLYQPNIGFRVLSREENGESVKFVESDSKDYPFIAFESSLISGLLSREMLEDLVVTLTSRQDFQRLVIRCDGRIKSWHIGGIFHSQVSSGIHILTLLQYRSQSKLNETQVRGRDIIPTRHPNVYEISSQSLQWEVSAGDQLVILFPSDQAGDGSGFTLFRTDSSTEASRLLHNMESTTRSSFPLLSLEVSGDNCTGGNIFYDSETLSRRALLIQNVTFTNVESDDGTSGFLYILPNISFPEEVLIVQWRFAARARQSLKSHQYPSLQVWREQGSNFTLVASTSVSEEPSMVLGALNVFSYDLNFMYQPGDLISVYQPPLASSRLQIGFMYANNISTPNLAYRYQQSGHSDQIMTTLSLSDIYEKVTELHIEPIMNISVSHHMTKPTSEDMTVETSTDMKMTEPSFIPPSQPPLLNSANEIIIVAGSVVGGVILIALLLIFIFAAILCVRCRRQKRRDNISAVNLAYLHQNERPDSEIYDVIQTDPRYVEEPIRSTAIYQTVGPPVSYEIPVISPNPPSTKPPSTKPIDVIKMVTYDEPIMSSSLPKVQLQPKLATSTAPDTVHTYDMPSGKDVQPQPVTQSTTCAREIPAGKGMMLPQPVTPSTAHANTYEMPFGKDVEPQPNTSRAHKMPFVQSQPEKLTTPNSALAQILSGKALQPQPLITPKNAPALGYEMPTGKDGPIYNVLEQNHTYQVLEQPLPVRDQGSREDAGNEGSNEKTRVESLNEETRDDEGTRGKNGGDEGARGNIHESFYVPTENERKDLDSAEDIYQSLKQKQGTSSTPETIFFEECEEYWAPEMDIVKLYQQLARRKYREIPRDQIQLGLRLGSGEFGNVFKGVWEGPQDEGGDISVAIKTLKNDIKEKDKLRFLQEGAIIGQFHHPNIVKLLGMITVRKPIMIVLELLPNGDLLKFLSSSRSKSLRASRRQTFPPEFPKQLLGFCRQVASGMTYLSNKGFIHRDLAARNILLTEEKTCKIADFGMSRDLDERSCYVSQGGSIPVRWTAPEALNFRRYSTASDVWSFGVVLYEIWSLGRKPFWKYKDSKVAKIVEEGHRLKPPPGCMKEMYALMIKCWHPDLSFRPSFDILLDGLHKLEGEFVQSLESEQGKGGTRPDRGVASLGAPLEQGYNLYVDLQRTYLSENQQILT